MDAVEVSDYSDYLDYLEVHPDEFPALFNTILINVTGFFRDPPAWDYYAGDVVPRLLEAVGPDDPIRVWSAGCASGEEAYTLAMVLAEALGAEAFRERVKIYATDVDEDALNQARQASYAAKDVEAIPRGPARALLRAGQPALHVPQGPAAQRDLRPQRPRPGRADLAHRPADVPQHAHVLQRGDAVAHPRPLPLRAEPDGASCSSASPRC